MKRNKNQYPNGLMNKLLNGLNQMVLVNFQIFWDQRKPQEKSFSQLQRTTCRTCWVCWIQQLNRNSSYAFKKQIMNKINSETIKFIAGEEMTKDNLLCLPQEISILSPKWNWLLIRVLWDVLENTHSLKILKLKKSVSIDLIPMVNLNGRLSPMKNYGPFQGIKAVY